MTVKVLEKCNLLQIATDDDRWLIETCLANLKTLPIFTNSSLPVFIHII